MSLFPLRYQLFCQILHWKLRYLSCQTSFIDNKLPRWPQTYHCTSVCTCLLVTLKSLKDIFFPPGDYIILASSICKFTLCHCTIVTRNISCTLFITSDWSDSPSNLYRIMKASPSEAILIPLANNPAHSAARHRHSSTQLQWFIGCGRWYAWHRGGALYLPSGRETRASDQAVVKMGPRPLLAWWLIQRGSA